MNDWGKPTDCKDLFVESTSIEELRARRVWRFMAVILLTWIFFAAYLWIRSYTVAANVCIANSLTIGLFDIIARRSRGYRVIMNLNLAASAVGLFAVAISDPALHGTMLFYPVSIVVASQLLGVRSAAYWLVINLAAMGMFFVCVHGFESALHSSKLDELVLLLGVALCVFFCCQQGEQYYQRRTKSLISLSENLEEKSQRLETLATTDAVTGLMNRFQFQERLAELVREATSNQTSIAVFVIDMDGFKEVNDTFGHPVGDQALVAIAQALDAQFGSIAEVARFGGDEFCIIVDHITDDLLLEEFAAEISRTIVKRYVLEEVEVTLGASVGYCRCPEQATTAEDVLSFADTAMFHAKANGMGYINYHPAMTKDLVQYRKLQDKLAYALERDQFFLVYQPQINLRTMQITGVEALLRWSDNGTIISPFHFISALEKSREIIPVGKWIIQEACRQQAKWAAEGHDINVSLNVSPLQFNDQSFIETIQSAYDSSGVDPVKMDFEITESLLISDVDGATEVLRQIKALGSSISIDDFGTGYSSLSYLRQFPISRLKIDRAFVKDFPDADDGLVASCIIVLAKSLGLTVLAEGVETQPQLDFLKQHDCDEFQGYYCSEPRLPNDVAKLFPVRPSTVAEDLVHRPSLSVLNH